MCEKLLKVVEEAVCCRLISYNIHLSISSLNNLLSSIEKKVFEVIKSNVSYGVVHLTVENKWNSQLFAPNLRKCFFYDHWKCFWLSGNFILAQALQLTLVVYVQIFCSERDVDLYAINVTWQNFVDVVTIYVKTICKCTLCSLDFGISWIATA